MDTRCYPEGAPMTTIKPYGLIPPKTLIYPTYTPFRSTLVRAQLAINREERMFRSSEEGNCGQCDRATTGVVIAGCLDAHIMEQWMCAGCLYKWTTPQKSIDWICPVCYQKIADWRVMYST
jgi:hypothetical protein